MLRVDGVAPRSVRAIAVAVLLTSGGFACGDDEPGPCASENSYLPTPIVAADGQQVQASLGVYDFCGAGGHGDGPLMVGKPAVVLAASGEVVVEVSVPFVVEIEWGRPTVRLPRRRLVCVTRGGAGLSQTQHRRHRPGERRGRLVWGGRRAALSVLTADAAQRTRSGIRSGTRSLVRLPSENGRCRVLGIRAGVGCCWQCCWRRFGDASTSRSGGGLEGLRQQLLGHTVSFPGRGCHPST
jgi:hypothetical protein